MALDRFKYERACVRQGAARVGGADEAGRGPLAGPVVAAVVVFPTEWIVNGLPRKLRGLNDSKQLTADKREHFYNLLTSLPEISFAIATVEVEVIDNINILQASLRAMNQALEALQSIPDHTLIDGPHISSIRYPQTPIIDGDARSYSIGAASILAKVTRDRLMTELDARFPGYGFAEHKGYATARHLAALEKFGPCSIHRKSFAPIRPEHPELFPARL